MPYPDWTREFPADITVCDRAGIILTMNDRAVASFASDGGAKLIGTNVLDCHPEPSRSKLEEMLRDGSANTYTVQRNGKRKLITQQPWYENGEIAGIVEIAMALPDDMPHHDRDTPAPGAASLSD